MTIWSHLSINHPATALALCMRLIRSHRWFTCERTPHGWHFTVKNEPPQETEPCPALSGTT